MLLPMVLLPSMIVHLIEKGQVVIPIGSMIKCSRPFYWILLKETDLSFTVLISDCNRIAITCYILGGCINNLLRHCIWVHIRLKRMRAYR